MAQQINLYSPILLAPRRYFSALAMVQLLGVFAFALALVCGWAVWSTKTLRTELSRSALAQAAEHEQLARALAARAPKAGLAALEQEVAQLETGLAEQRGVLDELLRGRVVDGRSHAAMLELIAQTVPPPVWLTELRLLEGRLELTGMTLQTQTLRPWLAELAKHPLTAGQRLAAVKVERSVGAPIPDGVEAWAFHLVSSAPHADKIEKSARPGATR